MTEEIRLIENSFDVAEVVVNKERIWPLLKHTYISKIYSYESKKGNSSPYLKTSLMSFLYGWRDFFRKYDVICFSSCGSGERMLIEGKYRNRFCDSMIDIVGKDKVLLIEKPAPIHFPKRSIYTRRVVSERIIDLIRIFVMLIMPKINIKNKYILNEIKNKYSIKINDEILFKKYYAEKLVYKFIFKIYKPKAIFVDQYYNREGRIKAAKELKIPVIEFQHGLIGPEHDAYTQKEVSRDYYPDYLLSFGRFEITNSSKLFIYSKNQVYPIGSYYIDHINQKNYNNFLIGLTKKYNHTVAVTLDYIMEEKMVQFIKESSIIDSNILYILIPRPIKDNFGIELPDNIKIITNINFYKIMACVDFHCTTASTCALEAPSLGVQNILINIHNLAKKNFGKILIDETVTKYVDTPKELVFMINNMEKLNKHNIIGLNNQIFVQGYEDNLRKFLQKIGLTGKNI